MGNKSHKIVYNSIKYEILRGKYGKIYVRHVGDYKTLLKNETNGKIY